MIRKSQMDLLDAGRDEARVQEIGERIVSLRERRQNVLTQAALRKDEIDRIKAMITFIEEQTGEAEYSEILVRRMIEKVTIHDDRITVEFKSGLAIDVMRNVTSNKRTSQFSGVFFSCYVEKS